MLISEFFHFTEQFDIGIKVRICYPLSKEDLEGSEAGSLQSQRIKGRKEQKMRKMKKSRILWLAVWLCLARFNP